MESQQLDVSAQNLPILSQPIASSETYLDPEGGYPDPAIGRAAELAAMTR